MVVMERTRVSIMGVPVRVFVGGKIAVDGEVWWSDAVHHSWKLTLGEIYF